ncbi:MAG: DoxX family protein [Haloechinothrix sp.]
MSTDDELNRSFSESVGSDDPSTSGGATTGRLLSDFDSAEPIEPEPRTGWHAGLDLGLLILRVALGGTMIAHGLQKFNFFGGPGIEGFAANLEGYGFTQQTTLLSWITAATEVGGGGLLVLGLFTPIGAAGVLGVLASVIVIRSDSGFFIGERQGFEFEVALAAIALALLFTGPGRVALDANTPWRRNPVPFGLVALLFAVGAAVTVLLVFR